MTVRRLAHWLAFLAIALHAAWPLIANAKPKSAHLVPLCTVEGVTHYIEVPGGSTPLDDSANSHHDHCSFCFLGAGGLVSSRADLALPSALASERIALGTERSHVGAALIVHGARAPPLSSVVTDHHNNSRGQDETNLFAGRAARALHG
jgi:hypothetical protein